MAASFIVLNDAFLWIIPWNLPTKIMKLCCWCGVMFQRYAIPSLIKIKCDISINKVDMFSHVASFIKVIAWNSDFNHINHKIWHTTRQRTVEFIELVDLVFKWSILMAEDECFVERESKTIPGRFYEFMNSKYFKSMR